MSVFPLVGILGISPSQKYLGPHGYNTHIGVQSCINLTLRNVRVIIHPLSHRGPDLTL